MNPEELSERTEEAHKKGEKLIGLTTAIVAVFLAVATLLGHRAHTEEIKLQAKVNDGWQFYQAKHSRAYQFGLHAEDSVNAGRNDIAARDLSTSIEEECGVPTEKNCTSPMLKRSPVLQKFAKENATTGAEERGKGSEGSAVHESDKHGEKPAKEARKEGAVDIQEHTRDLEKETERITQKANFYDAAELFLEVSIVLCAIALLAEARVYWRLSFLTTAIGIGIAAWGWLLH